jgi:type VI secretion system protein ImpM
MNALMPTVQASSAAGWHGKLPTVGDFATRRLDSDFVHIWDNWLSTGLARLRTEGDGQWLDAYLASPTWRFVLTPGFLPEPLRAQAWAGVVMPSVDRVGRYYPLTIACPLPQVPQASHAQAALWSWLHRLEDLAVDALQEDWSIDRLEMELARQGLPAPGLASGLGMPGASPADAFFSACFAAGPGGCCVWYSESDLSAPQLMQSTALDESILRLWKV